ncbi:MAG TPA: DUF3224 domain-containing protein [Verrucomicrobiae bacterium]|jgi:hypothetical protein|nr:DUF3224 domain-containing protein [Verrucomicrobiae bacterium]
MSVTSKSTFTIKSWKDEPSDELGGGTKLTRTKATQTYQGSISGGEAVEYLMCAGGDGVTYFSGFERIAGTLDGKTDSFVIHHVGTFAGEPHSEWTVVAGSGTGELAGLIGKGSYAAKNGVVEMLLTYDLGAKA